MSVDRTKLPEEIKARLTIEEVIGSYVPLKKMGRVYKGLCPFHTEKTPSFTVNPERGIFKCFGCGEGGDMFDFIQKLEGLNFPESVELLARRAGLEVPEWKPGTGGIPKQEGPSKVRLFSLNSDIADFWHAILTKHPKAESAREYLRGRGLTDQSITDFKIGYAPYGSATREQLSKQQFSQQEVLAAGDPTKFQDRITFPISDITGKVVAFTGRLLEHSTDSSDPNKSRQHTASASAGRGPKYWNTPETPLFVKSRTVYALHLAKHAIQDAGLAILAEGQMDVVMLHQAGYRNAVASSGTALTPEQLRLISRFTQAIAFAYDADKAGQEATRRGLELAVAAELTPYVIAIPNGKDPADCIQNDPKIWEQALQHKLYYMDWLIRRSLPEGISSLSPENKRMAARELVTWLDKMNDPTEKAEWYRKVAAHLQTEEENLHELSRRLQKPGSSLVGSTKVDTAPDVIARPQPRSETSLQSLTETALAIIYSFPEVRAHLGEQLANLPDGSGPFQASLEKWLERDTLTEAEHTALALAAEERLQPYSDQDASSTWALSEASVILHRIREQQREKEKQRIAEAIQRAQTLGQADEVKKLFQELQNLV